MCIYGPGNSSPKEMPAYVHDEKGTKMFQMPRGRKVHLWEK